MTVLGAADVRRNLADLGTVRVIELSHVLFPGQEEFRLEVTNRYVEELQPFYVGKRAPDAWYIMSEVALWSHVGTHMESPFHYLKDGTDIAGVELDRVVGMCQLVDFRDKGVAQPISREELRGRGSGIEVGDIVFIRTDSGHYRTEQSHDHPYLERAAIDWLVEDRRIRLLGVDCSGIERRTEPAQPNHETLFKNGIPLIEHLAYLDRLTRNRFFVVAVPWRVKGLEATPVSVVAFEKAD
ncbi:MAG: cyclase family protein [Candidatus Limnocylindrales bacterium]|jgi:arylformamidase